MRDLEQEARGFLRPSSVVVRCCFIFLLVVREAACAGNVSEMSNEEKNDRFVSRRFVLRVKQEGRGFFVSSVVARIDTRDLRPPCGKLSRRVNTLLTRLQDDFDVSDCCCFLSLLASRLGRDSSYPCVAERTSDALGYGGCLPATLRGAEREILHLDTPPR